MPAQGHTAGSGWTWDLNLWLPIPSPMLLYDTSGFQPRLLGG